MQRDGVKVGLVGLHFKRMVLILVAIVAVFAQGKTARVITACRDQREIFPAPSTKLGRNLKVMLAFPPAHESAVT